MDVSSESIATAVFHHVTEVLIDMGIDIDGLTIVLLKDDDFGACTGTRNGLDPKDYYRVLEKYTVDSYWEIYGEENRG